MLKGHEGKTFYSPAYGDVETHLPELEKELAKNLWRDTRNFFI